MGNLQQLKFIQIATGRVSVGAVSTHMLYGLTPSGLVFRLKQDEGTWKMMPCETFDDVLAGDAYGEETSN